MSEHDPSKAPEDWPPPLSDAEKKARIAELTEKVKSEGIALWENAKLKARIAELEARILALETVTDEDVERAAKAYDDACMTPTFSPCPRCDGKGYHHGFGEHGTDPDWCDNCGGGGEIDADPLKPIRAALSIRRGE